MGRLSITSKVQNIEMGERLGMSFLSNYNWGGEKSSVWSPFLLGKGVRGGNNKNIIFFMHEINQSDRTFNTIFILIIISQQPIVSQTSIFYTRVLSFEIGLLVRLITYTQSSLRKTHTELHHKVTIYIFCSLGLTKYKNWRVTHARHTRDMDDYLSNQ